MSALSMYDTHPTLLWIVCKNVSRCYFSNVYLFEDFLYDFLFIFYHTLEDMLPSPSSNHIIDLKHIIYSTQQINKYAEEIRNCYERELITKYILILCKNLKEFCSLNLDLVKRYEIICKENVELKRGR